MSLAKKLALISAIVLASLAGFVLIGVVGASILDLLYSRRKSALLFYAVWFVAAVFCGVVCYNLSGRMVTQGQNKDWTSHPDARKTSLLVIVVTSIIVAALSLLFYHFSWNRGADSDLYVPDSVPLTITYFGTVVAAMILMHRTMASAEKSEPTKPPNSEHT